MAPIDDKVLEKLLTRHLSSQLEGQVGRAELAFRQRIGESSAIAVAPSADAAPSSPSSPTMRLVGEPTKPRRFVGGSHRSGMGWFLGVAGTAIAASLATLFLLPHLGLFRNAPADKTHVAIGTKVDPPPTSTDAGSPVLVGSEEHPLVRYVHNSAWDEGTVTPDESGLPMRRVRYQQVERVRYYDPQRKAVVEVVVPRENVQLYELDSY